LVRPRAVCVMVFLPGSRAGLGGPGSAGWGYAVRGGADGPEGGHGFPVSGAGAGGLCRLRYEVARCREGQVVGTGVADGPAGRDGPVWGRVIAAAAAAASCWRVIRVRGAA
jgi:hypothetical protein